MRQPRAVPLAVLLLPLLFPPAIRAGVSFVEPQALPLTFPSNGSAYWLAAGDFNGDGNLDLAAATLPNVPGVGQREFLAVLLGDGGGSFQAPVQIPLGPLPDGRLLGITNPLAEDFDRDGRLDIVIGYSLTHQVAFLKGRGDGTFEPPILSATRFTPGEGRAFDLDGDGLLDIAIASNPDRRVEVLHGKGDGTFASVSDHGTSVGPGDMAIGDLDGNGSPDLVVGCYDAQTLDVLLNGGNGSFPPTAVPSNMRSQVTSVSLGDFDGDGVLDAAFTDAAGPTFFAIAFAKGKGDGTFTSPPDSAFQATVDWPGQYGLLNGVARDLNGDGKPDVVACHRIGALNMVTTGLGRGDGSFDLSTWVASPGTGLDPSSPDRQDPVFVVIGDFEGDGAMDLAVASQQGDDPGGLSLVRGDGKGGFHAPRAYAPAQGWSGSARTLAAADFTGDGLPDIAAVTGAIDIFPLKGDGTLAPAQPAVGPFGEFYSDVRAADFDGDKLQDVAWAGHDGVQGGPGPRLLVGYGDGKGAFSVASVIPTSEYDFEVEDLNGDSHPDLVVLALTGEGFPDSFGRIEAYLYDPSGPRRFVAAAPGPDLGALAHGQGMAAGDFDGDGKADVVTLRKGDTTPNQLVFIKGKGDGTFQGPVVIVDGIPNLRVLRRLDLDGDGKMDLLGAGSASPVYVFRGKGDGTFAAPRTFDTGDWVLDVQPADFDGDGRLDLAVAQTNSSLSVLPGLPDGSFGPPARFATGRYSLAGLTLADLDGDGRSEVIVAHGGGRNPLVVLRNDSGPRADLAVTMTQDVSPAQLYQAYTCTVTVLNHGPEDASDVRVLFPLRVGAAFAAATPSQGSMTRTPTLATFQLGALAAGASAAIPVQLIRTEGFELTATASAWSATADPNTGNNSAAAVQPRLQQLRINAPQIVGPGGTYDILLEARNLQGGDLQDGVLVLALPFQAGLVSAGQGGIYHWQRHHVFWKLGDLARGDGGQFSARVQVDFGVPVHTPVSYHAFLLSSNAAQSVYPPSDYLTYSNGEPSTSDDLTPEELDAVLKGDPELQALFDMAVEMGYRPPGAAFRITRADGSQVTQIWMARESDGSFAEVVGTSGAKLVEVYERSRFGVLTADGGAQYWDLDTQALTPWRTFGVLLPGGGAVSPTCMAVCIASNVPGWIASYYYKQLSAALSSKDCLDWAVTGNSYSKAKCVAAVQKITGTAGGAVTDILNCYDDCLNHPERWNCSGPNKLLACVAHQATGFYSLFSSWTVDQIECLGGIPQLTGHVITSCTARETAVAVMQANSCSYKCVKCGSNGGGVGGDTGSGDFDACVPGEVRTANDPNFKTGPAGEVTPGEVLDYSIEFSNDGEATAFAVSVEDPLDALIDDSKLTIDGPGVYVPSIRTIVWEVGDVPAGKGGTVSFHAPVRADAPAGKEVVNVATVVFPSVPQATATNAVVSRVQPLAAEPASVETESGVPVAVTLQGSGPAGRPLSFSIDSPPVNGELTGVPPDVSYSPAPNFTGPDSFTFVVSDGVSQSDPAKVSVVVDPGPADVQPPSVLTVSPAAGAIVPAPADALQPGVFEPLVKTWFDEPLDPASVADGALTVQAGGTALAGQVALDAAQNRILFLPSATLQPGTEYRATVSTAIRDLAGNALAAPFSWTFRTFPPGALQADPAAVDFGAVALGATRRAEVRIDSLGASALTLQDIHLEGDAAFSLDPGVCKGASLAPSSVCPVTVSFAPAGAPAAGGTLVIVSDSGTVKVPLAGSGRPPVPGTISFSAPVYDVNGTAGRATITVTRTGGSDGEASVDFATADGTAKAPGDYTSASGTISFADGDAAEKTFSVLVGQPAGGGLDVALMLKNAQGAALGTASAELRIHGEARGSFVRADSNCDGRLDLSDPIFTLGFLFLGEAAPCCPDAADADGSGKIDITDAVYTLGFLFLGGGPPPAPFPACGGTGCAAHPCGG